MHFTVLASPRAPHQLQHQASMATGLRVHGIDVTIGSGDRARTKHVACWGWRAGKRLRAAGHEVLVMERGYLGDRFGWTSLAWNGLNGRGNFAPAPNDSGKRFNDNFSISPWKKDGEYILLMGQVPGDASLQGRDLMPWYRQICLDAGLLHGLPVAFRQHPVARSKGHRQSVKGAIHSEGDLSQAFSKAALVITYNSNSAVDAVLAGVPTIAIDIGSMARPVTGHSLREIVRPDRSAWAAELAWRQWHLKEIEDGSALTHLLGL